MELYKNPNLLKKVIMNQYRWVFTLLIWLSGTLLVVWGVGRLYSWGIFYRDVERPLQQVMQAKTVTLAYTNLNQVVTYLKQRGYTQGYTSILSWFIQPVEEENLGIWYANLCRADVKLVSYQSGDEFTVLGEVKSQLVGRDGELWIPHGVSVFPHNDTHAILLVLNAAVYLGGRFLRRRGDRKERPAPLIYHGPHPQFP